jgi:HK97 family phage portal protein
VVSGKDGFTSILETPNPYYSWEDLLYVWTFHMKLTGKAFWLLDEIGASGPKTIYPLLPHLVKVVPGKGNTMIDHYTIRRDGVDVDLSTDEVIFFRKPHPMDYFSGLGEIAPSKELFKNTMARADLDSKFIEAGAVPSGVMSREEEYADEIEWDKMKKKFNEQYSGRKNAGKVAFLSGKWTYTQLGLNGAAMQAMEQLKWGIEQVFMVHGVPLSMAGMDKAANRATAIQDEINFKRLTVIPLIDLLVGKVNQQLLAKFPSKAGASTLSYKLQGLVDVGQVVKDLEPLFKAGGLTPNEYRMAAGFDKVEGDPLLDQHYIASGVVPVEMAGLTGASELADETKPSAPPKKPPVEKEEDEPEAE